MITRSESGLTEAAYNAVLSGEHPVAQQVLVQRRNLLFGDMIETGASAGLAYDTAQDDDYLYLAYVEGGSLVVQRFDLAAWTWDTAAAQATDVNGAIAPSFGASDTVYFVDSAGDIYRARSTDQFDTSSVQQSVDTSEAGLNTLTHIAGVSNTEVIAAEWRADYNTRFHLVTHNVSVESSFVYWPHKITGMDAIRMIPPTAVSYASDLVVISSVLPYQMGLRAVGTNVETVALERSGLIAFEARGQNWSDHYVVDQFDDSGTHQFRQQPRLTQIENELGENLIALTAYGVDGDEDYHHAALRLYFSSTGKEWGLEQLFEADDAYGAMLYRHDDKALLVSQAGLRDSDSTELAGCISSAVQIDITERVLSHSISHSGIRQSNIELSNLMDWVSDTLLDSEHTFSMITKLGAHDGAAWRMVPIGHQIVDSIVAERQGPSERLRILARDMGSLLTSVRSPHVRENDTQTIGADNFWDDSGTGYGGLRHTAAIQGSWSTEDNQLKLSSNNKIGIASMTFNLRVWNGSVEAKVDWASDDNQEIVGVVFRVYDKDNYYRAYYNELSDEIMVDEIRAGEQVWGTNMVGNLGWTRGEDHYIKAAFYYSSLKVFVSDDGATWEQVISTVMPGKAPAAYYIESTEVPLESGSVGYIGRGYSTEDNWDWDWDFDDGVIPSPVAPNPGAIMGPPGKTYALTTTELRVTGNILATPPAWTQIWTPPVGQFRAFLLDLADPKQKAMVVCSDSSANETYIYELTSLASGSPAAALKQTLPHATSSAKLCNTVQWADTWFLACRSGKSVHVYHTHDRWTNITSALNAGRCEGNPGVVFEVSSNAASQTEGNVYVGYIAGNGTSWLRRSVDMGHSFSNFYQFGGWNYPYALWVPWLENGNDQYIYAVWGGKLYVSANGGVSFADKTPPGALVGHAVALQQYNPISYTNGPRGLYLHSSAATTVTIHRTLNAGDSWEQTGTYSIGADNAQVNFGGWPFAPFDTIFMTTKNQISVSEDGGATWSHKQWAGFDNGIWTIPLWVE